MNALSWLAGAILVIMFAYVFVRSVSFAYFRTRLEYLRSALRELRKDDHG